MSQKKLGTVLFLPDPRAPRERLLLLHRALNAIRPLVDLQILSPSTTEAQLLLRLEEKTPVLTLVPWHYYLEWNRVEAFYGLTRTSGPVFAGYFCEPMKIAGDAESAAKLQLPPEYLRAILLDFSSSQPTEALLLIRSLLQENRRSGILPLLERKTPVYTETWLSATRLGPRIDALLSIPELSGSDWSNRGNDIRICLNALWSLIFEEGPGKTDFHAPTANGLPRAYFQLACDSKALFFRLFYSQNIPPKEILATFFPVGFPAGFPGGSAFSPAAGVLRNHADFLRIQSVAGTPDIELVAGLWASTPARRGPGNCPTFWIEPIAPHFVVETPFESPSSSSPLLKKMPVLSNSSSDSSSGSISEEASPTGAENQLRELKKLLNEREVLIRELKAGGVGVGHVLPPPDMEAIVEAFRERFFEARHQIQEFEREIARLEENPGSRGPQDRQIDPIGLLRFKINALALREEGWIKQIQEILQDDRKEVRAAGKG